jgi:hypothetical protein
MSTVPSPARIRALLPSGLPRPRLTIVPRAAADRAPRIPFVVLVVLVLGVGLVGLLLLNTALQRGAYELKDLKSQSAALQTRQQGLEVNVAGLRQPQSVARAALALGMVRNDAPAFLDLEAGQVKGSTTPARATDRPVIGSQPPEVRAVDTSKSRPPAAGQLASAAMPVVEVPTRNAGQDTRGESARRSPGGQRERDTNDVSTTR